MTTYYSYYSDYSIIIIIGNWECKMFTTWNDMFLILDFQFFFNFLNN